MTNDHADTAKHIADFLSLSVVVGVLVDWLPTLASLLSVIWFCIQISQSQRFAQFMAVCGRAWRWLREH